eukprot:s1770_g13.t1
MVFFGGASLLRPDEYDGDLVTIHAISLRWLDRKKWLQKLSQKAGHPWLVDEEEHQQYAWSWVMTAPIGDTIYRREGLWFVVEARVGHKILLTNYEDQCFEALRLSVIDLHAMD